MEFVLCPFNFVKFGFNHQPGSMFYIQLNSHRVVNPREEYWNMKGQISEFYGVFG